MTVSTDRAPEAGPQHDHPETPLGAEWRARVQQAQQQALPSGSVVVSCGAPFGGGGLGRHLQEIVDALERGGQEHSYICASNLEVPESPVLRLPGASRLLAPLNRLSPGRRLHKQRLRYDAAAARRLPRADQRMAFSRQALTQLRAARAAGYEGASLVAGSPHVESLAGKYALAHSQYPIERSFGSYVSERYLAEYEQADRIYVASSYTWDSLAEHGIPEERLVLFPLTPDPRYRPDPSQPSPSTFNVVYVGGVSVGKGTPLLIDAFRRLPHADMRLVLVGNSKTPPMRRLLARAVSEDDRIEVAPGDPLPHLRAAGVCVHPSYADGFAYSPAEAMACGVPVLVSEDTGMKELIEPHVNGLVLPTGDVDALSEAIDATYRRDILGG
jgi:glycosyltransferase involved in cell wall biosynthesis